MITRKIPMRNFRCGAKYAFSKKVDFRFYKKYDGIIINLLRLRDNNIKNEMSEKTQKNSSITQVAKLTGVSTSMLRKYEREGVLRPGRKEENF